MSEKPDGDAWKTFTEEIDVTGQQLISQDHQADRRRQCPDHPHPVAEQ